MGYDDVDNDGGHCNLMVESYNEQWKGECVTICWWEKGRMQEQRSVEKRGEQEDRERETKTEWRKKRDEEKA